MLILPKDFPRFKYEGAVVIPVISSWAGDLSVIPEKETVYFAATSTASLGGKSTWPGIHIKMTSELSELRVVSVR